MFREVAPIITVQHSPYERKLPSRGLASGAVAEFITRRDPNMDPK